MIRKATAAIALSALALAGCGGPLVPPSSASAPPPRAGQRPAPNAYSGASMPQPSAASAGSIAGLRAADLARRFGPARLDLREGNAHKLQFTNSRCVLDAYLYPPRAGAEPVVTHVDARTPEGADTDRNGCIAALSR